MVYFGFLEISSIVTEKCLSSLVGQWTMIHHKDPSFRSRAALECIANKSGLKHFIIQGTSINKRNNTPSLKDFP